MKKIVVCFWIFLFATTATAGLIDRLENPFEWNDIEIAIDSFIIGTENAYIVNLVRSIGKSEIDDLRSAMQEVLNKHDREDLNLVEKYILTKKEKKIALVERNLVLADNLGVVLSSELMTEKIEFHPISEESLEYGIWNVIVGPEGLGKTILGDEPMPVHLSADKSTSDMERYVALTKKEIGGLFLDKEDIKQTKDGCTARVVEAFNFDGEVFFGGKVYQNTSLPYQDAFYAVSTIEFSFVKRAYRQLRFTVFGLDQKIIYSVKIVNPVWLNDEADPTILSHLSILSKSLPENLNSKMSKEVREFHVYAKEKHGQHLPETHEK